MANLPKPFVLIPAFKRPQPPQDDTPEPSDSIEVTQSTDESTEVAEDTPEPAHNIQSSQIVLDEQLAKSRHYGFK